MIIFKQYSFHLTTGPKWDGVRLGSAKSTTILYYITRLLKCPIFQNVSGMVSCIVMEILLWCVNIIDQLDIDYSYFRIFIPGPS